PYSASGQVFYRDTLLSGFGLRGASRSKGYFAEGQVNRDTRRVTSGRADLSAPEVARKKALALLGEMAEGRNPNEEKRKETVERVRWPWPSNASSRRATSCRRTPSPTTGAPPSSTSRHGARSP